jgi:hypothetical protein
MSGYGLAEPRRQPADPEVDEAMVLTSKAFEIAEL